MPAEISHVTSPRSERVRRLKALGTLRGRRKHGLFILEGAHAVEIALYQPAALEELWGTQRSQERYGELFAMAREAGVPIRLTTSDIMSYVTDTVTSQEILAVASPVHNPLEDVLTPRARCVALLESVRDPGNLGTIIRVAHAAGVDAVVTTHDSVDIYNPKVVRSTTGSLLKVPIAIDQDFSTVIDRAHECGLQVLGTSGSDAAHRLDTEVAEGSDLDISAPSLWVFGNEAHGLSAEHLSACDTSVSVPLYGDAESLNIAIAAAICLYDCVRAQRAH